MHIETTATNLTALPIFTTPVLWTADLSTSDVLAELGYSHVNASNYARDIVAADGSVVFTGTVYQVNRWLIETGQAVADADVTITTDLFKE